MGSDDVDKLAVLGGLSAYQQHRSEVGGGASDALRSIMPELPALGSSRLNQALTSAYTWRKTFNLARVIDDEIWWTRLSDELPSVPFNFDVVASQAQAGNFEAVLQYYPDTLWEGLPPKAVVSLLAEELGLDLADVGLSGESSQWSHYPAEGTLRLPPEFFRRPAPFSLLERTLLKLSKAYKDVDTRVELQRWAAQLEG